MVFLRINKKQFFQRMKMLQTKIAALILLALVCNCGDTRPLNERDLDARTEEEKDQDEHKELSKLELLSSSQKNRVIQEKNPDGLYVIIRNYLVQRQDELNVQFHNSNQSRQATFVLEKNIPFGKGHSFFLDEDKKLKLGNLLDPRVLSSDFSSYVFWHCSTEGQEGHMPIDISKKPILILEITQANTSSYSCRVKQKTWDAYSDEDEKSMIVK